MRVILCDDHAMLLDALSHALELRGESVVATVGDPNQLLDVVRRETPDACFLDVAFESSSGLDVARALRQEHPAVRILLLTAWADEFVWAALDEGVVDGLVNKTCSVDSIHGALRRALNGERVTEGWRRTPPIQSAPHVLERLTNRERQVLDLIVDGLDTGAMSRQLGVSENTVRTHVQGVLRKLSVHQRTKAVQIALAHRRSLTGESTSVRQQKPAAFR
ncbi:MAG: response regulator transcription factor [Nocardioidaceae bacterium]